MLQTINDLLSSSVKDDSNQNKLEEKLENIKQKSLESEVQNVATTLGVSYIDLVGFPISPDSLSLIPLEQSKNFQIVCFAMFDKDIKIATTNIQNPQINRLIEDLKKERKKNIELFLVSDESMHYALDVYENAPKMNAIRGVAITEEDIAKYKLEGFSFENVDNLLKDADVSEVITVIIAVAIQFEASDIHIEAQREGIKIRLRIDGVLSPIATIDLHSWSKIISRIKLFSGLKINITERPQDGRFTIHIKDEDMDVRVSTIPTNFGESVVMRLLRSSATSLEFDQLGVRGSSYVELKRQIERPNGMIISTGPTGSGKTTSLYAILKKLNSTASKIITLEDPIEYRLEGINQSQIKKDKEYSFAAGLKSILRQDPDVVMVGEIRDLETADTAINAALTGHLVISTIHTNSASGAIPRFLAMGVKPFLLSPALNAIIGQRLVRKVCEHCKEEESIDNEKMTKILNILGTIPENSGSQLDKEELGSLKFYKGKGCEKCHGLGYKGRIGIYEILVMSKEIESVILENKVSEYVIQELAQKNGMITMVQDGLLKAKDGLTTVEEVFAVAD